MKIIEMKRKNAEVEGHKVTQQHVRNKGSLKIGYLLQTVDAGKRLTLKSSRKVSKKLKRNSMIRRRKLCDSAQSTII